MKVVAVFVLAVLAAAVVCFQSRPDTESSDQLRLLQFYGDHMLFQRHAPIVLQGWASPGAQVHADDGRGAASTAADDSGRWRIALAPQAAAAGLTIEIRSGAHRRTLRDVAIGDLWFASGQSNMGWPTAGIAAAADDIAAADIPGLRLYAAAPAAWREPREDGAGDWHAATPHSVRDFSALAYFFARRLHAVLGVPVGVIQATWAATRIEPWQPGPHANAGNPHNQSHMPGALYNAMVHPYGALPLSGVIWYQGESNVGDIAYRAKFEHLIARWRERWDMPLLPFLYAQVAPFDYGPALAADALPLLWEAQIDALRIAGTGMVSTLDLNPALELHPQQKRELAERFAALALQRVYGVGQTAESPRYRKHQVDGARVRVQWAHARGLRAADGASLREFELAGNDGVFHAADAEVDDDEIVVRAAAVPRPTHVRYAWRATPRPNLVNAAGLPALPFRAPR